MTQHMNVLYVWKCFLVTDPCGTPTRCRKGFYREFPTWTLQDLSLAAMRLWREIPMLSSLCRSPACQTLSKALSNFRKTALYREETIGQFAADTSLYMKLMKSIEDGSRRNLEGFGYNLFENIGFLKAIVDYLTVVKSNLLRVLCHWCSLYTFIWGVP